MPARTPAMDALVIRRATPADAAGMLETYGPIVEDTVISFEDQPPSEAEFAHRIEQILASHEWLVAEQAGAIAGYAYGGPHRARAAYRFAVETSVYVHPDWYGRGIGSRLYRQLLPRLAELGYHSAYAGITLPNDGSVALHERLGFRPIGVFPEVGWKFDAWHDVGWWWRLL